MTVPFASLKPESPRKAPHACDALTGADEAWLLRFFALHFERMTPGINGRDEIANICNKSPRHIDQALAGQTFLSVSEWAAIQSKSQTDWFAQWLTANYPSLITKEAHK